MYLHAHKWSRLVFIEIAMATAARREMAAHRKSHAVSASGLKRRRVIFFIFFLISPAHVVRVTFINWTEWI